MKSMKMMLTLLVALQVVLLIRVSMHVTKRNGCRTMLLLVWMEFL